MHYYQINTPITIYVTGFDNSGSTRRPSELTEVSPSVIQATMMTSSVVRSKIVSAS
jgi:hypothetical protein